MATWKSAAYDGRYLQLDISESVNVVGNSSTLSWTLTSTGGASTYYTIDTTTVTINGTTVSSSLTLIFAILTPCHIRRSHFSPEIYLPMHTGHTNRFSLPNRVGIIL